MSINVPTWYVRQYADNIAMLLQQKGSKLRDTVTVGNYVGEQASPVDQIGSIEMQPVTTRFGPMGRVDAATDRRWVFPADYDLPQLIDTFDKLRLLTDPASVYVQNGLAAAGRRIDNTIVAAFFAAANTGVQGATSTSFPAANQVAVNFGSASSVGLTVAKLIEAKRLLMSYEVDFEAETPTCVITSDEHADLLKEAQVVSTDFNDRPVLVDGMVTRFLGINFKVCERLTTDGSGYRRVPVYVKSGMHLGIWNDINTDISRRVDLQGIPWQAYIKLTIGATRIEENRVIEIKCA